MFDGTVDYLYFIIYKLTLGAVIVTDESSDWNHWNCEIDFFLVFEKKI